jgi:hypothetical protein
MTSARPAATVAATVTALTGTIGLAAACWVVAAWQLRARCLRAVACSSKALVSYGDKSSYGINM